MNGITTHVLDTARGRPAQGIAVTLEQEDGEGWRPVGGGTTDVDGRLKTLLPSGVDIMPGVYRLTFDTQRYFDGLEQESFYPHVIVVFRTRPGDRHYHVPLLLGPFGYTTYRGT